MPGSGFLVIDANVLVDYAGAGLSVLGLVHRHVAPVRVPITILREVEGLDEAECERHGFQVVEPTLEQVVEATALVGRLSLADATCLVLSRDARCTCVTNDKALRNACEAAGVPILWGLELMLDVVQSGHLLANDAIAVAERIHEANPRFVSRGVVDAFRAKVLALRHP